MTRDQVRRSSNAPTTVVVSMLVVCALVSLGLSGANATVAGATGMQGRVGGEDDRQAVEITLITGDTVVYSVTQDGLAAVHVPEDSTSSFLSETSPDGSYLIPSAAAPYIREGVLDREFFNLKYLVENGYDDATMPDLPVIVEAVDAPRAATAQRVDSLPAITVTEQLESIDASAAAVDKTQIDKLWATLTHPHAGDIRATGPPEFAGGVSRLWLDRKVSIALDESVPQIGAPQAWASGFDGAGVLVAVLDTGIDLEHPDTASNIVGAENFTNDASAIDGHGHGTHVASTISGSGDASDGQYIGVAPGAELLIGKVLGNSGTGLTSWIIEGMEWAAEEGADVVNMSIGGTAASSGTDPISAAVNQLTASHDVLFVVAAGNMGPSGSSISSPGAADAALTVGAIDKQGELADFSSRGPVVDNHRIKPEITAPGVGIVAARAGDASDMDGGAEPVGDWYARASGTSMATPHVAGAAAILAQQNPGMTPNELKAALAGTARPHVTHTVYEQGVGRIDVARAISQRLYPDAAALNFGFFDWPHEGTDEAVTETVTYTNLTAEDVALDLSVVVTDEDGDPASSGSVSTDVPAVTVPASGSASVDITFEPTRADVGRHGGYLTAAGEGVVLRTAFGYTLEGPTYHLTVKGIRRDSSPAGSFDTVQALGISEDAAPFADASFTDGTATLRLPAGDYSVMSFLGVTGDGDLWESEQALVGDPQFSLTGDTTVTLDAREAVEVQPVTPEDTETRGLRVGYFRSAGDRSVASFLASSTARRAFASPTGPVDGGFEFYSAWTLLAPDLIVDVVEPESFQLRQEYMVFSPTLDGTHRLALVDGGIGSAEDLRDVDGKAVLIQRTSSLSFAQQAENAAAAGAVFVIIYNDRLGRLNGAVSSARIPVVAVSQRPGEHLRALLESGPVEIRLEGIAVSPYLYDLLIPHEDYIPSSLTYDVGTLDLATIDASYHSYLDGQERGTLRSGWRPYETQTVDFTRRLPAPFERTEFVSANDTRWRATTYAFYPFNGSMSEPLTFHQPGADHSITWYEAPIRPSIEESSPVQRQGDTLALRIWEFGDAQPGHRGPRGSADSTAFRLLQDDQLIAEAPGPVGEFDLPAEAGSYRMELDVTRNAPWWPLSVRTHTAWEFSSARPADDEPQILPILVVHYDANVNAYNQAPAPSGRRGPATIDFHVRHQADTGATRIAGALVWVSYDDGATWRARPTLSRGDGRYQVILDSRTPAETNGYMSVRLHAWDSVGNRIEQDIFRAWALQ